MTAKAQNGKNGKTQAKKVASKKTAPKTPAAPVVPVSVSPLLDAAKLANPHQAMGAGGWDKNAAQALAFECARRLAANPQMPLIEAVKIIDQYKSVCGWANAIQSTAILLGIAKPTRKLNPLALVTGQTE